MAKTVIINASPLIFLSRSGHVSLLKTFADEIWVPEQVAKEIQQRGAEDLSAQAIENTEWLVVKPVSIIPITIAEWRLGAGESGVLSAVARQHRTTNNCQTGKYQCTTKYPFTGNNQQKY